MSTAMQLSPSTPSGWLLLQFQARLDRIRNESDRGASPIEWVIITAVLVAIAAAVGVIIYNFVINQGETEQQPPVPGRP
jgi:flagellar basal body-associated protein FliL